jgi:hypothetical protein
MDTLREFVSPGIQIKFVSIFLSIFRLIRFGDSQTRVFSDFPEADKSVKLFTMSIQLACVELLIVIYFLSASPWIVGEFMYLEGGGNMIF